MMNNFWDLRYYDNEYAYGTNPNEFFRNILSAQKAAGNILLPADGEGRNSCFAAKSGWNTFAFDSSEQGRRKALKLYKSEDVEVDFRVMKLENMDYPENSFDMIALIFVHMTAPMRREVHKKLIAYLKPEGLLILESFSKKQIRNNSGGPKDINRLYSIDELKEDFAGMDIQLLTEKDRMIKEGKYHKGNSNVIDLIVKKI